MLRIPKFNLITKFKPRIVHTFVFLEIRWGILGISNQIFTRLSPKRKIIDFRLKSKTDSHFLKEEKNYLKLTPCFQLILLGSLESSRTFEQEYFCLFLFIQVLIILVSFKTGEHCTKTHVGGLIRAAECQTQLKVQAVGSSVSQSPSGTKLQKSAKN